MSEAKTTQRATVLLAGAPGGQRQAIVGATAPHRPESDGAMGTEGLYASAAAGQARGASASAALPPKNPHANTTLTVDAALALLESNNEQVSSEIAKLLLQLVPLLQFGNRELNLGLGFAISAMEKRLQMILEDQALAGE